MCVGLSTIRGWSLRSMSVLFTSCLSHSWRPFAELPSIDAARGDAVRRRHCVARWRHRNCYRFRFAAQGAFRRVSGRHQDEGEATISNHIGHRYVLCNSWTHAKLQLCIERSDVTESMATIRSPFCRYNMAQCVELRGEDLSCSLNKIQSIGLWKCRYNH